MGHLILLKLKVATCTRRPNWLLLPTRLLHYQRIITKYFKQSMLIMLIVFSYAHLLLESGTITCFLSLWIKFFIQSRNNIVNPSTFAQSSNRTMRSSFGQGRVTEHTHKYDVRSNIYPPAALAKHSTVTVVNFSPTVLAAMVFFLSFKQSPLVKHELGFSLFLLCCLISSGLKEFLVRICWRRPVCLYFCLVHAHHCCSR